MKEFEAMEKAEKDFDRVQKFIYGFFAFVAILILVLLVLFGIAGFKVLAALGVL